MKNITLGTTLALSLLALSSFAYAYPNNDTKMWPQGHGPMMMGQHIKEDIKTAVQANNYALLTAEQKQKITAEEFALHVKRYQSHEAIEKAIKEGNYTAFRDAKIAQIPTEAEFRMMATKVQEKETHKSELETLIKNNDFVWFKAFVTKKHQENGQTVPTEEKIKKHFDALVKHYTKTSTIPEHSQGRNKKSR